MFSMGLVRRKNRQVYIYESPSPTFYHSQSFTITAFVLLLLQHFLPLNLLVCIITIYPLLLNYPSPLTCGHHCGHPVQICDSNHTHNLRSFQQSWLLASGHPKEREKSFTGRNGDPTWPEDHFLNPFMQRRRKMAHHVPNKGF